MKEEITVRKIAICDDSKLDRQLLKVIIQTYFENSKEEFSIFEYESGDALLADIEEGYLEIELLFLDIIMNGTNGMEIARKLRNIDFKLPIVFLTAYADYAVESYEVHASGYLLKPYDVNKLTKLLDEVLQKNIQERIAIKVKRQYRYIIIDDIMYIESNKHVLNIYLNNGESIQTVEKLNELEKMINLKRFIRCHQSYLVNMDYIKDAKTDFILINNTKIPIRVRGRKEIIEKYHKYYNFKRVKS